MRHPLRPRLFKYSLLTMLCCCLGLAVATPAAAQNNTTWTALLSGGQEVPSNASHAFGTVILDVEDDQLRVSGSFHGLSSEYSASHIHTGLAGQNGGVTFPLTPELSEDRLSGTYVATQNTFTLSPDQMKALAERRYYVNVHSGNFPAGEIRGQVARGDVGQYHVVLSGTNEVPANTSLGMGGLLVELSADDSIWVSGAFSRLSSDFLASHLHTGVAGENGGVIVPLNVTLGGDSRSGTVVRSENKAHLTPERAQMMRERGLYANFHSATDPGGEIRGQVRAASTVPFTVVLNGSSEVPAASTAARGALLVELAPDTTVVVSGSFSGLEGTYSASHLHTGFAGESGPVAVPLSAPQPGAAVGMYEYSIDTLSLKGRAGITAEQVMEGLSARWMYANIHSSAYPGGEIRGQLAPSSSAQFRANLTGRAEVPANMSPAFGGALVEVRSPSEVVVSGAFHDLSSDYTAYHIHLARLGVNGGVIEPLNVNLEAGMRDGSYHPDSNRFTLPAGQVDSLVSGKHYVNVHSATLGGGEIRGQVLPVGDLVFEGFLAGINEAGPVRTPATGGVIAVLHDSTLTVAGNFRNLEADFAANIAGGAHIHEAAPGASGGIRVQLTTEVSDGLRAGSFPVSSNVHQLTSAQVAALVAEDFYANVHTTAHTSGEIRGQLLPSTNRMPTAPTLTAPAEGATLQLEQGSAPALDVQWNASTDPNRNRVVYVWQIAEDAAFDSMVAELSAGGELMLAVPHSVLQAAFDEAGVDLSAGGTFHHRVVATDASLFTAGAGRTLSVASTTGTEGNTLPAAFALRGNAPNPVRGSTAIRFDLPASARVSVQVMDVLGRRVLSTGASSLEAGHNRSLRLNTAGLASGVYFYRVTAEMAGQTKVETGRMVLVR